MISQKTVGGSGINSGAVLRGVREFRLCVLHGGLFKRHGRVFGGIGVLVIIEDDFIAGRASKQTADDGRTFVEPALEDVVFLFFDAGEKGVETGVEVHVSKEIKALGFTDTRFDDELFSNLAFCGSVGFMFLGLRSEDGVDDSLERPIDASQGDEHPGFLRGRTADKGNFFPHDAFAGIDLRSVGQGKLKMDFRAHGPCGSCVNEEPASRDERSHSGDEFFLCGIFKRRFDECNLRCHGNPREKRRI